ICPNVRKNLVVNFVCVEHLKSVSYVGGTVPESSPTAIEKQEYIKLPEDVTPEDLETLIPDLYEKTLSEKPSEDVTRTDPICDGQTAELRCNNGELMHIISAYYGKPEANKKYGDCLSIDQNSVTYPCFSEKTLDKVSETCEFSQSCTITPKQLLSHTTQCGGVVQHLIVDFVCIVLDNMPTDDVILYPLTVEPVDAIVSQTTDLKDIIKNVPKPNIGDKTIDFYNNMVNTADKVSVSQPTCDGHKLTISCKLNEKIHIVKAFYGKPKTNTKYGSCQQLDVEEAIFPCSKNNVLASVITKCEERESCILDLTTETFKMSKCQNIVKNLVVSAVCVKLDEKVIIPGLEVEENAKFADLDDEPNLTNLDPQNLPSVIVDEYEKIIEPQEGIYTVSPPVCDGQQLKLKCIKQDALIHIISAFYGKPEGDTKYGYCQKRDFIEAQFPCYSTSIVDSLRNRCENKKVCQIDVADEKASDESCGKIGNHLVVKFVCVYPFVKTPEVKDIDGNKVPVDSPIAEVTEPVEDLLKDVPEADIPSVIEEVYDSLETPKEPLTSTKPICDGDTVRLRCEEGETLHITSAFYGKVEANKAYGNCPAKDFFGGQFPCYDPKVLGIIQGLCEERKDCSILVSSASLQSNICPNVRKNLVVNFVCVEHLKSVSYVGGTVPESSPTAIEKQEYIKLP
ncbi:hypothetical protein SNEBB_003679, partial [Seison nebaliae]